MAFGSKHGSLRLPLLGGIPFSTTEGYHPASHLSPEKLARATLLRPLSSDHFREGEPDDRNLLAGRDANQLVEGLFRVDHAPFGL